LTGIFNFDINLGRATFDDILRRKFWLASLKGRDHLESLVVDWMIILEWFLRKSGLGVWIEFMWLGIVTGGAPF
jgi:hypothetical protein